MLNPTGISAINKNEIEILANYSSQTEIHLDLV